MYIVACKTLFSCIAQSCDHILAHLFIYTCAHNHVTCVSYPSWVLFPSRFNYLNVKQILPWLHFILKWMADLELKERHMMGFYFWLSYVCLYRFRRLFLQLHRTGFNFSCLPSEFPTRIRNKKWSPDIHLAIKPHKIFYLSVL